MYKRIGVYCFLFVFLISSFAFSENLNIKIDQLDANNFPFIYLTTLVDTNGTGLGSLTKDNFKIYEDETLQNQYFQVTPPQISGEVRQVDVVFIIDNSGSMGGEINAVKNNINNFANSLNDKGVDFRLGAVRFGQYSSSGNAQIFNNGNLTEDLSVFHSWINQMYASGSREPGIQAVIDAVRGFNFRPGSQRHILLITDEDSDGGSLATAIQLCNDNNVVVHVAAYCSYSAYSQYCAPNTSISGATGGLVFPVVGPYSEILDELGEAIANNYIISYRSDNQVLDGVQRQVIIEVEHNSILSRDTIYYTPGTGPSIERTSETKNLSSQSFVEGTDITIQAVITDKVSPGVSNAWLYFKHLHSSSYSRVSMSHIGGDVYSGTIPGATVKNPGVSYYIVATDGFLTASDPKVEPGKKGYHIAVLPNIAPVIVHNAVTTAVIGNPISIEAKVNDNTYAVSSVDLYYRKIGTLIYNSVGMTASGNDYSATIPGSIVTSDGLEYYIEACDDLGVISVHGVHQITFGSPTNGDCLTYGQINICADAITTVGNDEYLASGNVKINNLINFSGDLTITEHPYEIKGNGAISIEVLGNPVDIYNGSFSCTIDGPNGKLTNFIRKDIISHIKVSGLEIKLEDLYLLSDGVQVAGKMVLPPVVGGVELNVDSLIARISTGIDIAGQMKYEGNLKIWKTPLGLRKLVLEFDTFQDLYHGEAELDAHLIKIGADATLQQGELTEIGVKLEFGKPIPIGNSGLFLTDALGRVADINNPPPLVTIGAGITGGPEVAGTYVVKLKDLTLQVRPMEYFKGDGTLAVFSIDVAGGFLSYSTNGLDIGGWIDWIGIIHWELATHLDSRNFNGSANGELNLPQSDVFPLDIITKFLGFPYKIAYTENNVDKNRIDGNVNVVVPIPIIGDKKYTVYYRLSYNPELKFAVGTKYDKLKTVSLFNGLTAQSINDNKIDDAVWMEIEDGYEMIYIQINSPDLLPTHKLVLPNGVEISSTDSSAMVANNLYFISLEDLNKSYWIIDRPYGGNWALRGLGDAVGEISVFGSKPQGSVQINDVQIIGSNVTVKGNLSDFNDNLSISIGLDEDHNDYDGSYVIEKNPTSTGEFEFTFDISDFSAGKYAIYAKSFSGENYLSRTYWSGWLDYEVPNSLEAPSNLNIQDTDSSIILNWQAPTNNSNVDGYMIYWTDLPYTNNYLNSFPAGLNTSAELNEVMPGEAQWFIVRAHDSSGTLGNASNSVYHLWDKPNSNEAPVFNSLPIINSYEGALYSYEYNVIDAEKDDITVTLKTFPSGMMLDAANNKIIWQIPVGSVGEHVVTLQATDAQGGSSEQTFKLYVNPSNVAVSTITFDRNAYIGNNSSGVLTVRCPMGDINPLGVDSLMVNISNGDVSYQWALYENSISDEYFTASFVMGSQTPEYDYFIGILNSGDKWEAEFTYDSKTIKDDMTWILTDVITVNFNLDPNSLNVDANGTYSTGYISLPEPFNVENIDIRSVTIDNKISAINNGPFAYQFVDYNQDGEVERMVKFNRQELSNYLSNRSIIEGSDELLIEFEFMFMHNYITMTGKDSKTVKIIRNNKKHD